MSHKHEKGYFVGFSKCIYTFLHVQIKTIQNIPIPCDKINAILIQTKKRKPRIFVAFFTEKFHKCRNHPKR